MMSIAGLGPHGERAVPSEHVSISEENAALAQRSQFKVAVVLHTTESDWSRQQIAGIVATLGRYAAAVVDVVDCQFCADKQIRELQRLVGEAPDAIISIPIGNTAVADAHHQVSRAGIKLILVDNVPTGLLPGTNYASVVSADNFGLGQISASLLSEHVDQGSTIGMLTYGADFFVTNEREIAFRKWMAANRPDVQLAQQKFADVADAGRATAALLDTSAGCAGLFVVWDEPAMQAVPMLRKRALDIPVTTVDLGNDAAIELASGNMIKGIGAQQPYAQGIAAATATLLALVDEQPPPWIALPGLAVTRQNVIESYQVVWHAPAPQALLAANRA